MRTIASLQRLDRRDLAAYASLAVVAFLVRLVPLLRGGGLGGLQDYDDGVYFGSALATLGGRVPYRDFLMVQPPGILYVLAPFAALAGPIGDADAFAAARLGFMVLGTLNTVLVGLVARPAGRLASFLAAGLYAVWAIPAAVERTTWLIAPQTTLLLLALLVLEVGPRLLRPKDSQDSRTGERETDEPVVHPPTPRAAAFVGVLLGLNVSIQLWGAAPFAVVLAWLAFGAWRTRADRALAARQVRSTVACLAGGVAAFSVVILPIVLTSGGDLFRETVLDQLGRTGATGSSAFAMLRKIHLPVLRSLGTGPLELTLVVGLGVAALIVIAIAYRSPATRLWIAIVFAEMAFLVANPVFFTHYAGWPAPLLALIAGASGGALIEAARRVRYPRFATVASFAACASVVLGLFVSAAVRRVGTPFAVADVSAEIAGARCVTADSPVLLIETDTLQRDLSASCQLRLDPAGTSYDTGRGLPAGVKPRLGDPGYQQTMVAYYVSGAAALFARRSYDELQPGSWAVIGQQFGDDDRFGAVEVLVRSEPPGDSSTTPTARVGHPREA